MALYMVLEDFAGDLGTPRPGFPPTTLVGAGTLLDSNVYDIPMILSIGCPVILYNPATMSAAKTAFDKMSGGVSQISPDGNLLALLFIFGGVVSGIVGPSNVAYVDVLGTALGVVGDASKPFATIKQACTAMAAAGLTRGQVRVGPGVFIADLGLIPAALRGISVVGSGVHLTTIETLTVGTHLFDLGVDVARDDFEATNFTCAAVGGFVCRYDGATKMLTGNAFQGGTLAFAAPVLAGDIDVRRLGLLNTTGIQIAGTTTVQTCIQWICQNVLMANLNFTQDYDDANLPGGSALSCLMSSSLCANLVLGKQALIEAIDCNCDGTTRGTLTISVAGSKAGGVIWRDGIVRNVDFNSGANQLPDVPQAFTLDWTGTFIRTNFSISVVGAPPANFQRVVLTDAIFGSLAGVIGSGIHAICRGLVSLDGTGALIFTPSATGDVVPPYSFGVGPTAVAGIVQACVLPFRLASVNFAVAVEADNALTLPLAVTARTATGFSVTVTVAVGNLRATISYYGP